MNVHAGDVVSRRGSDPGLPPHTAGDSVFHSRNPFPAGGVVEDPATGAAAAALGAYLRQIDRLPQTSSFTVLQGEDMGRRSRLSVTVDANNRGVTVSGTAVPMPPAS